MAKRVTRRWFLWTGLAVCGSLVVTALLRLWRQIGSVASPGKIPPSKQLTPEPTAPQNDSPALPALEKQDQNSEAPAVENHHDKKQADDGSAEDENWKRSLGATGVRVCLLGLGGAGIVAQGGKEDEAVALMERALDLGVNYFDTAPTYANGLSERNMGAVMKRRRKDIFLATKTLDRDYDNTLRLAEQSLQRLQTDYIDLYQVHGIRSKEDVERAFRKDGALRAMERLKEEGTVRFLGVTGHRDPAALLYAIESYPFDCVLLPLNPADVHYASFKKGVVEQAAAKGLGIIAMKLASYGRLFRDEGVASMSQSFNYVCTLPVSTAIIGVSSLQELEQNVRLAKEFAPLSDTEMKGLEQLTSAYQEEANFYKHW